MNSKELIIYCLLIIVAVAVVASFIVLTQGEETEIKVLSGSTVYKSENITVQLTTADGNPIANQSVNITIIGEDGDDTNYTLVTDSEGKVTHKIYKKPGSYTLECVFEGSDGYKATKSTSDLEVKKMVSQEVSQSSSSAQYSDPHPDWVCEGDTWYSKEIASGYYEMYDKSTGRLIGNGDMPDRHGFHGDGYAEMYGHTVKYRKDGQYYHD